MNNNVVKFLSVYSLLFKALLDFALEKRYKNKIVCARSSAG